MNSAANRFGNESELPAAASLPQTGIDSSHGKAIATPAPRRIVRRDIISRRIFSFVMMSILGEVAGDSFRQKLRAGDNRFDQNAKSIVVLRKPLTHSPQ